ENGRNRPEVGKNHNLASSWRRRDDSCSLRARYSDDPQQLLPHTQWRPTLTLMAGSGGHFIVPEDRARRMTYRVGSPCALAAMVGGRDRRRCWRSSRGLACVVRKVGNASSVPLVTLAQCSPSYVRSVPLSAQGRQEGPSDGG